METKPITLKALDASGEGAALFSLWDIEDLDFDVTRKGFFGHGVQEVFMLPHHLWTSGQPPLAKGVIYEESEGAVYHFKMNLDLDSAKAWHSHFMFDLREGRQPQQRWSYGFQIRDGGSTPRPGGRGRVLHATKDGRPGGLVIEVSPVTAAAQPLGHTIAVRGQPRGLTFTAADLPMLRRLQTRMQQIEADIAEVDRLERQRGILREDDPLIRRLRSKIAMAEAMR